MGYGTNKKKKDTSLYYKDKNGVLRFKSNNKPVASGRASNPTLDPIDIVGFGGALVKNSAKLAGKIGINLSKKITKSDIVGKAYAKTVGPLIASAMTGDQNARDKNKNKNNTTDNKKRAQEFTKKSVGTKKGK